MSALRIARPGQPVRLERQVDPYDLLTPRQRHVLDVVRSYNGNRSAAARQLRVDVATVQRVCREAAATGVLVPRGVTRRGIPNFEAMPVRPRCAKPMRSGACGRPERHGGGCTEASAWFRRRVAP